MIGKSISHYRIIEELGRGGMGVVYKAEDTKLGRTVALKFLSPTALGTDEKRHRFTHEARAAASLNHPNICTVHEINEDGEQHFIAMEYIEGRSLREMIDAGPLNLDESIDIAVQTAQGMQEAHDKGIIHRDIKSANIMITLKGQVKITDFGLAKAPERTQLTKEGSTLGTVAYMSPEQARGRAVDLRSDIWSLGAALYEMITGRLPFTGDYAQAVIYSILNDDPEPPTALRTGVPLALERVILRCIEKDPNDRYQTAGDLASDLRRLERDKKSQASQISIRKSKKREQLKVKWWFPLAILATVVASASVFLPRLFESHVNEQDSGRKKIAVLPFENLGTAEDEYFADGMTEEITSRLASLSGLGVISRTSALQYKGTIKTIGQIGEELKVDYVLEGTVRWDRQSDGNSYVRVTPQLIRVSDDTHIWTDRYDEEFSGIFAVQTTIAVKVAEALRINLTDREQNAISAKPTENIIAYQTYLRGIDYLKYPHAPKDNYMNAKRMLEQAIDLDPNFTLAYVRLAESHRSLYFYGHDRSQQRLALAKEALDRAIDLQPDHPEVHMELGYYYYHGLLEYEKALMEFSIASKEMPNDTRLLLDIAYIWRRQGHFEQAIVNLEQAMEIDPRDAVAATELALTYMMVRKFEEGIRCCDIAMSIAPEHQWTYLIKASIYWGWTGDLVAARESLEQNPVKTSPSVIWMWYWQEFFERDFNAALDHLATHQGDEIVLQTSYAPKALLAGLAHLYQGEIEQARSSFESALRIAKDALDKRPEDPRVHSALGLIYAGLGREEEAINAGERAVEIYPVTKDAILGVHRLLDLTNIYAMIGEYDAALGQMEYLLSIPSGFTLSHFNISVFQEPLRETPGYKRLVRLYSKSES